VALRFGRLRTSSARPPEPGKSISVRAGRRPPTWFLIPFFGLFFIVGTTLFVVFFLRPFFLSRTARNWVRTPCKVQSAEVEEHRGEDSMTYSIEVRYTYVAGGRERTGTRYCFLTGSSSGYSGKKAVVDRLTREPETFCYVDPDDPDEAVLERGLTGDIWFGLIPLVFSVVGLGGLIYAVRKVARDLEGTAEPSARASGLPAATTSAGPVELKPRQSPVAKFIGIGLFAGIWNGIVSIFAWNVIEGWRSGQGSWFHTLFVTPFVLIGLGAIGAVVYQLLALFNPRPRLVVSSNAVRLGEAFDVRWELRGQRTRVGTFAIMLEGREEATYQRGTNTYTDKESFAALPIVELEDPRDMAAGSTSFTVPADTMHSFEAPNNKIVWSLAVHGDIAFWPDVKEEFAFTVLPVRREESRA
jgi:hypothetical protein